jgi:hypothetical protein
VKTVKGLKWTVKETISAINVRRFSVKGTVATIFVMKFFLFRWGYTQWRRVPGSGVVSGNFIL